MTETTAVAINESQIVGEGTERLSLGEGEPL